MTTCVAYGMDLCFFGGRCMEPVANDTASYAAAAAAAENWSWSSPVPPPGYVPVPLGATVMPFTSQQMCWCAPGYGPDRSIFIQSNCTLPNYAYMAVFFVASLVAIPITWELLKLVHERRHKRTLVRDVTVSGAVIVTSAWLTAFFTFVEDGMMELASISFGVTAGTGGIWLAQCGILMVRSATGSARGATRDAANARERRVRYAGAVFALVGYANVAVLSATSQNAAARNAVVCGGYAVDVVAMTAAMVSVRQYLDALIAAVVAAEQAKRAEPLGVARVGGSSVAALEAVSARLQLFRSRFTALTINLVVLCTSMPVVFLVFGSFPFVWAVFGATYVSFIASVGGSTLSIARHGTDSEKKNNNNNHEAGRGAHGFDEDVAPPPVFAAGRVTAGSVTPLPCRAEMAVAVAVSPEPYSIAPPLSSTAV